MPSSYSFNKFSLWIGSYVDNVILLKNPQPLLLCLNFKNKKSLFFVDNNMQFLYKIYIILLILLKAYFFI